MVETNSSPLSNPHNPKPESKRRIRRKETRVETERNPSPPPSSNTRKPLENPIKEKPEVPPSISTTTTEDFIYDNLTFHDEHNIGIGSIVRSKQQVSLQSFPYYLSEITKEVLSSSAYAHLVYKTEFDPSLPVTSLNRFLLLSGPRGSEIYQLTLAKALANQFQSKLFVVDSPPTDVSLSDPAGIFSSIRESIGVDDCRLVVFLSDLFVRRLEKSISESSESCLSLKSQLDRIMPAGVLVIASRIHDTEKPVPGKGRSFKIVKTPTTGMDQSISKVFPNIISIGVPVKKDQALALRKQLKADAETLTAKRNIQKIFFFLHKIQYQCTDLESVCIKHKILTDELVDRIVGSALIHHLKSKGSLSRRLSSESIKLALSKFRQKSNFKKPKKNFVVTDNEFEESLLSDVIPPDELMVTYDDIGALDNVKEMLKETVMLPLQRPELFCKGQLTKPYKGILLFGPPGTGKTMLAKAVATEAGASFINVSMSSINSVKLGHGEKYVKAVFSLASKLAPSVIFVDEVDSVLSARGSSREHEALRRLKNEFMTNWDGLRTKDQERVLVLAATNRPFDLDEAVIRRLPRRLMVGLPDSANREKILRVLLDKEELGQEVELRGIAKMTDGYSGSDLKNLCIAAAHCPIREILEEEKRERSSALAQGRPLPPLKCRKDVRAITFGDFKFARENMGYSVTSESVNTRQLLQWNDLYGEGGSRKKQVLSYFL